MALAILVFDTEFNAMTACIKGVNWLIFAPQANWINNKQPQIQDVKR
jgi:hypothetical protein